MDTVLKNPRARKWTKIKMILMTPIYYMVIKNTFGSYTSYWFLSRFGLVKFGRFLCPYGLIHALRV